MHPGWEVSKGMGKLWAALKKSKIQDTSENKQNQQYSGLNVQDQEIYRWRYDPERVRDFLMSHSKLIRRCEEFPGILLS